MIGWILAGLAAATVYTAVKENEGGNNGNTSSTPQPKTIKVRCRNCGNELTVADMFHVEGICPKCHGKYIVENGIIKNKGEVTVHCVSCGRDVKVPAGEYVEAKCDYCGAVFTSDRGTVYRKKNLATYKEGNKSTAQTKKQGVSPSWEVKTISMSEYPPSMDVKPYMTDNFYIGSYLCPCCRNNMYKTVFRMGGEEYISVNGKLHIMKRLFTCPHCLSFYAPIEGHRLSDGSVYFLQCKYSEDYIPLISHYNSVGTTQGRPDA